MKRSYVVLTICCLVFVAISFTISCQDSQEKEASDPIIGTWKTLEAKFNDGKEISFLEEYMHFTEGGFWSYQCKWSNPFESNRKPESLEDYKAIVDSYGAAFGTYKTKADSIFFVGKVDLKPQFTDNKFSWTYYVSGDTLYFTSTNWKISLLKQP